MKNIIKQYKKVDYQLKENQKIRKKNLMHCLITPNWKKASKYIDFS